MNTRCHNCKAKGYLQRDGKLVGNRQPYTVVCPTCNGVGHHFDPFATYSEDDGWDEAA